MVADDRLDAELEQASMKQKCMRSEVKVSGGRFEVRKEWVLVGRQRLLNHKMALVQKAILDAVVTVAACLTKVR